MPDPSPARARLPLILAGLAVLLAGFAVGRSMAPRVPPSREGVPPSPEGAEPAKDTIDRTALDEQLAPLRARMQSLASAIDTKASAMEERYETRLAAVQEAIEVGEVARAAELRERLDAAMALSINELRVLTTRLEADHGRLAARTDLDALRDAVAESVTTVEDLQARARALRNVLDLYTRGVGLVHGRFTVGRMRGSQYQPLRTPSGGPLVVEYMGTGFLVSHDGVVMTNRHVAEPWWHNDDVKRFLDRGLIPRFLRLTITFPERAPLEVDPATVLVSDDEVDLAAFRVPANDVPVLPLSFQDPALYRGSRVTVLGYPTGIGALLARMEEGESEKVLAGGRDTTSIIDALAKYHLVTPIITQGALNDVRERRVIYDAQTTSGGSGGPVFGPDGSVLGINFAVTRAFGGSNFGVPAEFAVRLLERMVAPTRVTADGVRAAVRALQGGK